MIAVVLPLRPYAVHHSVNGQFAIRFGDRKLIESSGNEVISRKMGGSMSSVGGPELDEHGKLVRLGFFDLKFDDQHQLLNLADDPKEIANLDAKHPERVKEMLGLLNASRARKCFRLDGFIG